MLETLEQQQEIYFNNLMSSTEESERSHWLQLLNEVIEQLIQLKYCT